MPIETDWAARPSRLKGRSFESALAALKPGGIIVINYVHGGAAKEVTLTVGTKSM